MDNLKANLPEASVISLYELLLEMNVSGGCNSVDYSIFDPDAKQPLDNIRSAVAELAESMGVTLHDDENSEYPYITYCMDCRDSLKNQGKDAVHILELIFGMGASNTHMIHEHDHDHDESDVSIEHDPDETHECDGNCSSCELDCGGNIPTESAPLPTEDERHANRLELKSVLLQLYWNEN